MAPKPQEMAEEPRKPTPEPHKAPVAPNPAKPQKTAPDVPRKPGKDRNVAHREYMRAYMARKRAKAKTKI